MSEPALAETASAMSAKGKSTSASPLLSFVADLKATAADPPRAAAAAVPECKVRAEGPEGTSTEEAQEGPSLPPKRVAIERLNASPWGFYELLGVSPFAPSGEMCRAVRKLFVDGALCPSRATPWVEARWRRAVLAQHVYEILSCPHRKKAYHQAGGVWA
jgi:hypothetical protein